MIDKSQGFKDAPPSYQHVLQSSSTNPRAVSNPQATLSPRPAPHTTAAGPKRHSAKTRTKATAWFPTSIFGLSKTAKQVRSTTQSLLRDLLSQARPTEHEWLSVLTSCAEACNAQDLNFSALLQEPFVEGHLPVYWAVLKRPAVPVKADHATLASDPDSLVLAILDASLPLNAQSIADARLACMTASDNALFVRLGQRYEGFSQRLGTDKMLLGGDTVDSVTVDEPHNGSGSFAVQFALTQFPLRMRVSKLARIEFVARGRLWHLVFAVAGAPGAPSHSHPLRVGDWFISLGLSEPSSAAWVDGRLSIVDHSLPPPQDPPQATPRLALRGLPHPPQHPSNGRPRPKVSLPIKTEAVQVSPNGPLREIVVSLQKFALGTTLQNE
ncbi:hypothetical protein EI94DRAFT_1587728 [Lactarius quietus]|nr:hypothetical protein EI94DRAFT_1587728 [Lactarius quietus]